MDLVIRVVRECLNLTPVSVKFIFTDNPNLDAHRPHESRRYCEWVGEVMKTSREVLLNGENICCLAAREILGLTGYEEFHADECLKELVRGGRFVSREAALRALMGIPRMGRKP